MSLELTDSGFDHTVLSELRTRLIMGQAEQLLLDTLLTRVRECGLLKTHGRRHTDSTAGREALAAAIGAEGQQLLQSVDAATGRPWLREVPAGDSQDSDSGNDAYYFETCRRHGQSPRICDAVVWALYHGMS